MKALLQRVRNAEVVVEDSVVSAIEGGLLIYLGVESGDGPAQADILARRAAELRIFDDATGRMNLALTQVGGSALVVSQFTLAADTRRGRRPSYSGAAAPDLARPLYERFATRLTQMGVPVECGVFRATMQVRSTHDGPVTLMIESTANEAGT